MSVVAVYVMPLKERELLAESLAFITRGGCHGQEREPLRS